MCIHTFDPPGHDTSASALTALVFELGRHPAVMESLRSEQAALVAARGPRVDEATLRDSVFADACVKEALRLYAIVGQVFKRALKSFELGGYEIRKARVGCRIWRVGARTA